MKNALPDASTRPGLLTGIKKPISDGDEEGDDSAASDASDSSYVPVEPSESVDENGSNG